MFLPALPAPIQLASTLGVSLVGLPEQILQGRRRPVRAVLLRCRLRLPRHLLPQPRDPRLDLGRGPARLRLTRLQGQRLLKGRIRILVMAQRFRSPPGFVAFALRHVPQAGQGERIGQQPARFGRPGPGLGVLRIQLLRGLEIAQRRLQRLGGFRRPAARNEPRANYLGFCFVRADSLAMRFLATRGAYRSPHLGAETRTRNLHTSL